MTLHCLPHEILELRIPSMCVHEPRMHRRRDTVPRDVHPEMKHSSTPSIEPALPGCRSGSRGVAHLEANDTALAKGGILNILSPRDDPRVSDLDNAVERHGKPRCPSWLRQMNVGLRQPGTSTLQAAVPTIPIFDASFHNCATRPILPVRLLIPRHRGAVTGTISRQKRPTIGIPIRRISAWCTKGIRSHG